jgi:hypothetical protein
MKKTLLAILAVLVVLAGTGLFAQSTKNVNMTVTLSAWYDLSIGVASLTFTDVAPDFVASPTNTSIGAVQNPVSVRAFAITTAAQTLKLSVVANSDLTAGTATIGIGAITWTASGDAGYVAGTMVKSAGGATAGSWTGSVLHWHEGSFSYFFLRNYVNQAPGSYTATATYTLSAI